MRVVLIKEMRDIMLVRLAINLNLSKAMDLDKPTMIKSTSLTFPTSLLL